MYPSFHFLSTLVMKATGIEGFEEIVEGTTTKDRSYRHDSHDCSKSFEKATRIDLRTGSHAGCRVCQSPSYKTSKGFKWPTYMKSPNR